jgi:hypothetical protein
MIETIARLMAATAPPRAGALATFAVRVLATRLDDQERPGEADRPRPPAARARAARAR